MTNFNYTQTSTNVLTKRQAIICTSLRKARVNLQQWIGDFLVSYNSNRDTTPLNHLFHSLSVEGDKSLIKMRVMIAKWISDTTNYKAVYKKEKDSFTITYKSAEEKELITNEKFNTTTFYQAVEEEGKGNDKSEGYKDIPQMEKALESFCKKALATEGVTKEMIKTFLNTTLNK